MLCCNTFSTVNSAWVAGSSGKFGDQARDLPASRGMSGLRLNSMPLPARVGMGLGGQAAASYRSLGVRPVFLARTFMAVGPRVTLSW
jgi:hypothetical protein